MKECKKRKDSYWGIHCDFHAKPEMGVIGKTLREEDIRTVIRELRPDFWQIDCKGHFGWVSYPSKLGNAVPEFAFDTLKMWRRVTKEEGVALYLHYSGVIDEKYCIEHPEERSVNADGSLASWNTRCAGKYVDELLIPQFTELAKEYDIDGVWVDGECWGVLLDYHPDTLAAFEKEYHICLDGKRPCKPGDPYYSEFREYNRELFKRYLRHYTDVMHERFPNLQIASNWAFSSYMPEPVSVNVDFLSGDNAPSDSFSSARFESRIMAARESAWDMMAVAQCFGKCLIDLLPKHPTQVLQQASEAIALGGGFQAGLSFLFDGSPNVPCLLNLKPVAEFMREREAYCFKGKVIPQAAMLLSSYDHKLEGDMGESKGAFIRGNLEGKQGLTDVLCDIGQSLEILSEHTLKDRYDEYKMLVVPELLYGLADETVKELLLYAENGGTLLLNGTNTCRIFAKAGAPFAVCEVEAEERAYKFLAQANEHKDQKFFTIDGQKFGGILYPVKIVAQGEHEVVAYSCDTVKSPRHPFAVIMNYGKGKIAAIGGDIGAAYRTGAQFMHSDLMKALTEKLYTPLVQVEAALGNLEIICTKKEERTLIHLINGNGQHRNGARDTEAFVPPLLDIKLSIQLSKEPKALRLLPKGQELSFRYQEGHAFVQIERVDMHDTIEIVY